MTGNASVVQPARAHYSAHDTVNKRWLDYELDAAKLIGYPMMTDVREPLTVAQRRGRAGAPGLLEQTARRPDAHQKTEQGSRHGWLPLAASETCPYFEASLLKSVGESYSRSGRLFRVSITNWSVPGPSAYLMRLSFDTG